MLTLIGIVLFAIGILLSIALHEIGHMVPAKRFGVKVTQYMVGFGPTLKSWRRGETEYGIKWIPLGGYIRMIGMFPPGKDGVDRVGSTGPLQSLIVDARRQSAAEVEPGDENRVFYKLPVPQKLVVMLGGPTMNLIIAAVLFTITLTAFGTPAATTTVDQVSACVIPVAEVEAEQRDSCTEDDPISPAAAGGLQDGDEIVGFEGRTPADWRELQGWIREAPGETVTFTVLRAGDEVDLPVTLIQTERPDPDDPDSITEVGFLGVSPTVVLDPQPLSSVPGTMWDFTVRSGKAIIAIPARMVGVWDAAFGGGEREIDGPIGVVGVSRLGGEVASAQDVDLSWKVADFLNLLASLNMALFLFNLLPVLPLDGGHVAGALYEGARRQLARLRGRPDPGPVDVARMLPVAYTVAVLLIGMSALLLYADIVNPITLGG